MFSEYVVYVCLQFQEKITYFIHFDEFSYLQYDDHLLQIMPALRLTPEAERSQDVDLLRQVPGHTQDPMGSEKCWHFCQKNMFPYGSIPLPRVGLMVPIPSPQ